MPAVSGMKRYAMCGTLRDIPDNEYGKANMQGCEEITAYNGIPEIGINKADQLDSDELLPNYFVPNFVRPIPEADEDPELDDLDGPEYDISQDVSDTFIINEIYRQFSSFLVCYLSLTGTSIWSVNNLTTPR